MTCQLISIRNLHSVSVIESAPSFSYWKRKVMRRHNLDNHPLFIAGRDAVNQEIPNGSGNRDSLIRKWRSFCKWAVKNDCLEIKRVTRDLVIQYGHHLKAEFISGEYASTTTACGIPLRSKQSDGLCHKRPMGEQSDRYETAG